MTSDFGFHFCFPLLLITYKVVRDICGLREWSNTSQTFLPTNICWMSQCLGIVLSVENIMENNILPKGVTCLVLITMQDDALQCFI